MAGSAGSPPRVYVCTNPKCLMVTVIPSDELPKGFAGSLCYGSPREGRRHDPGMKVEYVPLEQSDPLADRLASLLSLLHEHGIPLPQDAALNGAVAQCHAELHSYREATAGEGDDGA